MHKIHFALLTILLMAGLTLGACATAPRGATTGAAVLPPKVELERVEVASYFPYDPKIRVPLVLAFIFKLENPNDFKVGLESIKFTVGFEASGKPGEFFDLATPMVYDNQYIPAKTANQLRVVAVMDSQVIPGNLAVTSGARLATLGLKAPDLIQYWFEKIGDFPFAIRVSEGSANFTSERGDVIVGFEGTSPKK